MKNGYSVVVVGAGYAGLCAGCTLAHLGYDVTIVDKLGEAGGRNREMCTEEGFRFELGPSWLWMKDVHEEFYRSIGRSLEKYVEFVEIKDPAYRVFFEDTTVNVPSGKEAFGRMLESLEHGCRNKFEEMYAYDKFKYHVALEEFIALPSLHFGEYFCKQSSRHLFSLGLFSSQHRLVASKFKDERVQTLLEWPVIFVGSTPKNIPSLYSMLNYAAIHGRTWTTTGGMYGSVRGLVTVAKELGVKFRFRTTIKRAHLSHGRIQGLLCEDGEVITADQYVAGCDMAYFELKVLPSRFRMYPSKFWKSRELSPSAVLFYVGLDRKLEMAAHHMLFFDEDLYEHMACIYSDNQRIPTKPLFYLSVTSKTNPSMAPNGGETLFFLVPMPCLAVSDETIAELFGVVLRRVEQRLGINLSSHVKYYKHFCHRDFKDTYNSFKGNCFGLSNTLLQSAFLKPRMKSSKVSNLYYCGQMTAPGGGIPPCIISGQTCARLLDETVRPRNKNSFFRRLVVCSLNKLLHPRGFTPLATKRMRTSPFLVVGYSNQMWTVTGLGNIVDRNMLQDYTACDISVARMQGCVYAF